MLARSLALLALATTLPACADDGAPPPPAPDDFVAPATAADVQAILDGLGTCNDSVNVRLLTPRRTVEVGTLWKTAEQAPAELVGGKLATGPWQALISPAELGFGPGDATLRTDAAPCEAVYDLLSPLVPPGLDRRQFVHALFYLGEREHPYPSFPGGAIEPRRAAAPVALVNDLNVMTAKVSRRPDGTIVFEDVIEQHLPMYVTCERPLAVEAVSRVLDDRRALAYDRTTCDAGVDLDRDGDLEYTCVGERAVHPDATTCRFVVDGRTLQNLDTSRLGPATPVVFGGTLVARGTGDALTYTMTVDRFSHE